MLHGLSALLGMCPGELMSPSHMFTCDFNISDADKRRWLQIISFFSEVSIADTEKKCL